MKTDRVDAGLTRRQLLSHSLGVAVAAGAATTGCASIATRVAARSAPQAVRPMIHALADPGAAISSGAAWIDFCESLKPLVRHVTGPESLGNLQIQTEGIRCLGRLVSFGLDRFVEHGDPRHPSFYDVQTATRKYMGDNPDQTYRNAAIEGSGTYRIVGNTSGTAGIEIGVYAGSFRSDEEDPLGGRRLVDSLDERSLTIDDDGHFEIHLGNGPAEGTPPRNHLRLAPDANAVLIRSYFWDRTLRQTQAMPTIERLDISGPAPPIDAAQLLRGFLATTMLVDGSLAWWNDFQGIKTAPNELIVMPDDGAIQTPSLVRYINGRVELMRGEALIVEFDPDKRGSGEPDYWSWVLQNVWGETPDWRDRSVVLNNRDVQRETDGRVRFVVAHENPGVSNWLDMSGHPRLLLSLRWRGDQPLPTVSTRVVSMSELATLDAARQPYRASLTSSETRSTRR